MIFELSRIRDRIVATDAELGKWSLWMRCCERVFLPFLSRCRLRSRRLNDLSAFARNGMLLDVPNETYLSTKCTFRLFRWSYIDVFDFKLLPITYCTCAREQAACTCLHVRYEQKMTNAWRFDHRSQLNCMWIGATANSIICEISSIAQRSADIGSRDENCITN